VGGVLGGVIAARVGQTLPATAMLPILAAFHLVSALMVTRIGIGPQGAVAGVVVRAAAPEQAAVDPKRITRSGLNALAGSAYLRSIVALVFLAALAEGFLDLTLKGRVGATFAEDGAQLSFFATFYLAVSLLTLLFQATASRVALDKLGPARTVAILPASVAAAAAGALAIPGLATAVFARGTESVISNSLYRPAYEVLFTPVPPREKRALKALADVGALRIGDLVAAGIAQGVILLSMAHAPSILAALAFAASIGGLLVAMRLRTGYVRSLERSLNSRAIQLDLADVKDSITRTMVLSTLRPASSERPGRMDSTTVLRAIREGRAAPELVDEAISLLASDEVALEAIEVLRGAGPEALEPLIARLVDPREKFAVRRRIPLVLATYPGPRAVEGLTQGLGDHRFAVRYRSARGLSRLLEVDSTLHVEPGIVFTAILREVKVGAGVWEGRRLLDRHDDESWSPVMDDVIRERANRSLEHVFTLLALVLPRQPLRIAFRGLHASDSLLRGTALEYLETALPPEIRKSLWPHLEDNRPRRARAAGTVDEAVARLIQSNESIVIHLEELKRKGEPGDDRPGP
ncbi:MAG TPA: hypothetical protein VK527_06860, partial [Candidatus Limnocylindrales bacterium]|nr:hypothetical protein [Candidatus Limnocylindrales bacterium]